MMSKRSKQELTKEIQPRYLKANRAEKTKILDEFTAATGYHRKYATKLLKHGVRRKGYKKVGRFIKEKWLMCLKRSGKHAEGFAQSDYIPFFLKLFQ